MSDVPQCVVCDRRLTLRGLMIRPDGDECINTIIMHVDDDEDGVPLVCVPVDNWTSPPCYVRLINDHNALNNYRIAVRAAMIPKLAAPQRGKNDSF